MGLKTAANTFANLIFRRNVIYRATNETQTDYIGCEVLEYNPAISFGFRMGIITDVSWESSVWNSYSNTSGDWMLKIRYIDNGMETWRTIDDNLILTGLRYDNIDDVRPLHPIYANS